MPPSARFDAGVREGVDVSFARLLALRHARAEADLRAVPDSRRPGGFAGRRRGTGLDVFDLRPFADGDDLRHADAAATARTGRIHVRTFHEEVDRAALLVADFRRPMLWGTRRRLRSVAAAEALALVGWRVSDAGGKVGVLAVRDDDADYLPPRERERAMTAVAGALERAHRVALAAVEGAAPTPPLATALERAARLVPSGAAIVCATALDAPGAGFAAAVGALARRTRLVFLVVRDALDSAPPAGPLAFFGDDGTVRTGRLAPAADAELDALAALGAEIHLVAADAATPAPAERERR